MKTYCYVSLAAAFTLFFSSCAKDTGGPAFHTMNASLVPQPGKGLALIYFKNGFKAPLHLPPGIFLNEQAIGARFKGPSFYSYQCNPGPLCVSTYVSPDTPDSDRNHGLFRFPRGKTIQIDAGQTYYFTSGRPGFIDLAIVEPVSKERGESEIQGCRWENPTAN